jgi:hypothetical protein
MKNVNSAHTGLSLAAWACGLMTLVLVACGDKPSGGTQVCDPGTFCECDDSLECPSGEACLPFLDGLACQTAPDTGADADATDAGDAVDTDTDAEQPDGGNDAQDVIEPDASDVSDADVLSDTDTEEDTDADVIIDDADVALPDVDDAGPDTSDVSSDAAGPRISPPLSNPWIALETNRFQDLTATPPRVQQVAVVNTAGVFYHINSGDREMSSPTWSPDGLRLAFIARNGANRDLKVVDVVEGTFTTVLEDPPAGIANLDWDFSGRYIAFDAIEAPTGTASDTRDIYVFDFNTTSVTRLTTDEGNDTGARFDVDGNIWFISGRDGLGTGALFSIAADSPDAEERRSEDLSLLGRATVDPSGAFAIAVQALSGDAGARMIRYVTSTEDVTGIAGAEANAPDIAPDGVMLVFTTSTFGGSDIVLANSVSALVFDRVSEASAFAHVNATISPVESDDVALNDAFTGDDT